MMEAEMQQEAHAPQHDAMMEGGAEEEEMAVRMQGRW